LIQTLVDSGVDTCFMNPGTSEMHFVHELDAVPRMRGVLALFEGVATGAADGYARMTGRPAAVLLHLGPGLGNGLANLHNARRGHAPVVAVTPRRRWRPPCSLLARWRRWYCPPMCRGARVRLPRRPARCLRPSRSTTRRSARRPRC